MVAAHTAVLDAAPEPAERTGNTVEIRGVSRRFGGKLALDNLSLSVPTGAILGLVGENGAGKTTLIRHVLGLLKAQSGSVRVFGLDPVADPVNVLSRIGYLCEEPDLPGWMRVHEMLRYMSAFYPTWDPAYAAQLRQDFALDPLMKLKHLSKGQRARAGLLAALAFRPDLLLLDEPSSGLDPIVRRDILGAIIRTIADQGRTVLFSSHLLSEVERVSDRIAMIQSGRVLFCDTLDGIRGRHCRLTLRLDEPRNAPPPLPGALSWEGSAREWTGVFQSSSEEVRADVALTNDEVVEEFPLNLDEIFVAHAGRSRPAEVGR